MFFVDNIIRKMCLNRNKKRAEKSIAALSKAFAITLRIKDTILLFDATNLIY